MFVLIDIKYVTLRNSYFQWQIIYINIFKIIILLCATVKHGLISIKGSTRVQKGTDMSKSDEALIQVETEMRESMDVTKTVTR